MIFDEWSQVQGELAQKCKVPDDLQHRIRNYCIQPPTSSTTMSAFVFLKRDGASNAGHVGACFENWSGSFTCFSTDNSSGGPTTESGCDDKSFWSLTVSDADAALEYFERDSYTDWKRLDVFDVDPSHATAKMQWLAKQPYNIVNRNCENDVYDILHDERSGYGITANKDAKNNGCYIGWVQGSLVPNTWFDGSIGATASGIFPRGEGESCGFMSHEYCAGDLLGCCFGKCEVLKEFHYDGTMSLECPNFINAVEAVGEAVGDAIDGAVTAVKDAAATVGDAAGNAVDAAGDAVDAFGDALFNMGWP